MSASATAPPVSVLTLVRGRKPQLARLLAALADQTETDFELVMAAMQAEPPDLGPMARSNVRVIHVPGDALPLAAARNAAATASRSERLLFLDVDCIPAPTLVAAYHQALAAHDVCLMGAVRYLPPGVSPDISFEQALEQAITHPARPALARDAYRPEPDPTRLWGLSFALRRARFMAAGGFDPAYVGYGGEETDFAYRLAEIDTPFGWLGSAKALHQWHPIARPPLNHFDAIVANARRFHGRWDRWCLEYWLAAFVRMGLIDWSPAAEAITIYREPSRHDIDAAYQAGRDAAF